MTGWRIEDGDDGAPRALQSNPAQTKFFGDRIRLLAQQTEQEVLGPDVLVVKRAGLVDRQLDGLSRAGGESDLRLRRVEAEVGGGCSGGQRVQVDAQSGQRVHRHARAVVQQPEQQMLGDDLAVPQPHGLFVGNLQRPPCPVGEFVEAVSHPRTQLTALSEALGSSRTREKRL